MGLVQRAQQTAHACGEGEGVSNVTYPIGQMGVAKSMFSLFTFPHFVLVG